jgi:hypothetical protein
MTDQTKCSAAVHRDDGAHSRTDARHTPVEIALRSGRDKWRLMARAPPSFQFSADVPCRSPATFSQTPRNICREQQLLRREAICRHQL